MIKMGCGIVVLLMGIGLGAWVIYALLTRQPIVASILPVLLIFAFVFVGLKWIREGKDEADEQAEDRRRRQRRPASDRDDSGTIAMRAKGPISKCWTMIARGGSARAERTTTIPRTTMIDRDRGASPADPTTTERDLLL